MDAHQDFKTGVEGLNQVGDYQSYVQLEKVSSPHLHVYALEILNQILLLQRHVTSSIGENSYLRIGCFNKI
jgi:hypothetical protein